MPLRCSPRLSGELAAKSCGNAEPGLSEGRRTTRAMAVPKAVQSKNQIISLSSEMQRSLNGGEFVIEKLIGSGSFGRAYRGTAKSTGAQIAIKVEDADEDQLQNEVSVYKAIQGCSGVARLLWSGPNTNCRNGGYAVVMELLGPSVEDLFNYCNRCFSLSTVCLLARQMISLLQWLHEHNFVHQDVKPDNFCMGQGSKSSTVYIIDFGLTKQYRKRSRHIPYNEAQSGATGTKAYMSVNAMRGAEQSRRDDLESLAYLFIYLMRGQLPWSNLMDVSLSERDEDMLRAKEKITPKQLCKGLPDAFLQYLRAVRALKFTEDPNYDGLRALFDALLADCPGDDSEKQCISFDWKKFEELRPRTTTTETKEAAVATADAPRRRGKRSAAAAAAARSPMSELQDASQGTSDESSRKQRCSKVVAQYRMGQVPQSPVMNRAKENLRAPESPGLRWSPVVRRKRQLETEQRAQEMRKRLRPR